MKKLFAVLLIAMIALSAFAQGGNEAPAAAQKSEVELAI